MAVSLVLEGPELPSVSIVISHVNSARTIENCMNHLQGVDYPGDKLDVVVIDAGSIDGSIDIVKKFSSPKVRQIVEAGCSEAEGQSIGVRLSKGEVIMFTNSDIYVQPDWVRRHVGWLLKGFDLVGGAVFWGGDRFSLTWNQPLPSKAWPKMRPGLGLGFCNCSVPRKFLIKVGGLKNLSSQHDAEFAIRCIKAGGRLIMDPEIEVYHDHPFRSFVGNFRRSFGYAINHVTVLKASFGKLVAGSGTPVMPPVDSVLREIALVGAAQSYIQILSRARKWNEPIRTNFAEFSLIRVFSTKLGQLCGVVAGALRNKSFIDIKELHSSKAKSRSSQTGVISSTAGLRDQKAEPVF